MTARIVHFYNIEFPSTPSISQTEIQLAILFENGSADLSIFPGVAPNILSSSKFYLMRAVKEAVEKHRDKHVSILKDYKINLQNPMQINFSKSRHDNYYHFYINTFAGISV